MMLFGTAAVAGSRAYSSPGRSAPARSKVVGAKNLHEKTCPVSTDEIALGQQLFEDVNLSRDSTVSCATCHMPTHGFAEPRAVSHGIGVRARKRNAPSLINVAIFRSSFYWDGRTRNLEDQLRGVFAASGDMGIDLGQAVARVRTDQAYNREFRRVYGRPADMYAFLAAFVALEKSFIVAESRFDRFYLNGDSTALSSSEKRGWRLFRGVGCAGCHVPLPDPGGSGIIAFGEDGFHNLGVGYEHGRMADVGRYSVTHDPLDWGAFKTPSLRNVALTAPYMHDGSLLTLEDVVAFYARGGIKNPNLDPIMGPRNLTSQNRADLVAFLRTLTTEWLADSVAVRNRLLRFSNHSISEREDDAHEVSTHAREPRRDGC